MSNLREEFEKLRLVAEMLQYGGDLINFDSLDSKYCSKSNDTQCIADWLNAAWYAFQEQQKKLDAVKKMIVSLRNEFDLWSDDTESFDAIEAQIENLEELLK